MTGFILFYPVGLVYSALVPPNEFKRNTLSSYIGEKKCLKD